MRATFVDVNSQKPSYYHIFKEMRISQLASFLLKYYLQIYKFITNIIALKTVYMYIKQTLLIECLLFGISTQVARAFSINKVPFKNCIKWGEKYILRFVHIYFFQQVPIVKRKKTPTFQRLITQYTQSIINR